jgi:formylmethanofuran dehydrogenase subunit E
MFDLVPLKITWKQVQTTAEPCEVCKEIIYGNQYQQHLNGKPTEQIVCEPCYELMKQEQEKLDNRE